MRVAVVGARGFVGRHLCRTFEQHGAEVIAISSSSRPAAFDETTGILVRDALPDCRVDSLIYLSQSPLYRDMPRQAAHLWGVNVVSAIKAAEWAVRHGAQRVVYASTGNVYSPSFGPHSEYDPTRADEWYPLSKLHAESALRLIADTGLTSTRLFSVYGPGQRARVIPNIAGAILRGERIRLQPHPVDSTDADGIRLSPTYVDDVVRLMVRLARDGGPPVVNVAGSQALSMREIASAIGARLGRDPVFDVDPHPRAFDLVADNTLLSNLLDGGLTRFAAGLKPTIDEFLSSAESA